MARRVDNRVITVSVVGLSGTEKEKGVTGVGKSCLCNRFMDPRADNYHTDHISVLSQSDFGGQVVNNDHFLYWGEVTKTSDEGVDHMFKVLEQTEFVDDSSFQPFKCGKTEPYYKRCAQVRLQSAEKLMYICKTQLGLEHEFDQVLLPEGRLVADGFLCTIDVSLVQQRPLERQIEYTAHILTNLLKTKKPVVLVTTKNDEAQESYVREVDKLLARKEFRSVSIPIVETSAHENVNVELAFLTLAQLIDKHDKTSGKARLKSMGYIESARIQKELRDVAREAYLNLIRSHVTDHKALWTSILYKIRQNDNYIHFQDLCGTDQARKLFQRHMIQLKEQYLQRRRDQYLEQLGHVLRQILPDLYTIADRSWPATLHWLQRQDVFDDYFVVVPNDGCWRSTEFIESNEQRIPYDLMDIPEAEKVFRNHLNGLRAEQKRNDLMMQFKRLLEKNQNLTGKSLAETAIFFLGHQCFSGLSEEDKTLVYEQHQEQLREIARGHFIELLQERAALFNKYEQRQVMEDDIIEITAKLQADPRYRAMSRLEQDRRVILLNHLGFVQCPSREQCPYGEHCMERLISTILATKAHRPQSWSRNSQFLLDAVDNRLNLVLLGAMGLGEQLALEIRLQCIEDEYALGNEIYSLDYRPIDGDVALPHNSFKTADFKPHGCFCVFNSVGTLMYLIDNLRKTLLNDLQRGERLPFQGLPVVIVLAHNPEITDKDLMTLRDEGQQLADRLQCPFIDIPSSLMIDRSKRFHQDQIGLAMYNLVKCIQHRSSFVQPWHIAESIEPDIRILMCFMCGDNFQVDLPLAPLLNHQCCYVTADKFPTITLETYLDDSKRKVEVTVTSYHGGTQVRDDLYHGFMLVYSAKRKASLANLGAFADSVPPVPTQIIAVSETGGPTAFFASDSEQTLIVDGNALADKLNTRFMITCANFRQQTASYTPFFKEAWEKKLDTEQMFQFSIEDTSAALVDTRSYEAIRTRPPASLPKDAKKLDAFGVPKSSTSNSQSTEDSEPIYDHPHQLACHTDSDMDDHRASSTSPPPGGRDQNYSHEDGEQLSGLSEDLYNEQDTEHLLKPSQLKSKRAMYADKSRKSPMSLSSFTTNATYRDDSTDTDSSARSPRFPQKECYLFTELPPFSTFKKSSSMKLGTRETDEGIGFLKPFMAPRPPVIDRPKVRRLLKSTTLPTSATLLASGDEGNAWEQGSDKRSPPPTLPKPKPGEKSAGNSAEKPRVGVLDFTKYSGVCQVISRTLTQPTTGGKSRAPLATPEHIEIGDYAQVKDALPIAENAYASVADALPSGRIHRIRGVTHGNKKHGKGDADCSDSDSDECSSIERDRQLETIYSRVNRRPTPHKKRTKTRNGEGGIPTPPLPPYTDDRQVLLHNDRLHHSASGSEGTGDELRDTRKVKKKRSFRSRRYRPLGDAVQEGILPNPQWSDSNPTDSPLSKASVEDENSFDPNTSGEFSPRNKDKSKEQMRKEKEREKEEKRKKKEEEKRQKEQQKLRKKVKGRPGLMSQNSTPWGTVEDQRQSDENAVPLFVEKCIEFIEEAGLSVEGLYRVPGNRAQVEMLIDKFIEDPNVDISTLDIPVNAVATALKYFFAELLAEPLIPNSAYDDLVNAAIMRVLEDRLVALKGVLGNLPTANQQCLRYLVGHMVQVSKRHRDNSMTSQNLSICWWPTLLRPDIPSLELMATMATYFSDIIQTIIDHHDFFFDESDV